MSPAAAGAARRRVPGIGTVTVKGTGKYVVDSSHPALPSYFKSATCYLVAVDGLPTVEVDVAVSANPVTKKSTVVFHCGADGSSPWFTAAGNPNMVSQLVAAGCQVLDIRWPNRWVASAPGQAAGMIRVAARVAAILRYVHSNFADGLPFILVGGSGATSALTYALAWYGLKDLPTKVVLASGPTNIRVDKFCMGVPNYSFPQPYGGAETSMFDAAFGYDFGTGPCALTQPANTLYLSQGLDSAAVDLDWLPSFPLRVLWGGKDLTPWPYNAQDWMFIGEPRPPWFTPPASAPNNTLICSTDPLSPHELPSARSGAALMSWAILGQPGPLQSKAVTVPQKSSPRAAICAPTSLLMAHGAPVAVNAGTLLVGFVQAPPGTVNGPPGWINPLTVPLASGKGQLGLWYKVATGAEHTDDFSWAVPAGVQGGAIVTEFGFGLIDPALDGVANWVSNNAVTSGSPGQAPLTGNVGGAYELAVLGVALGGSAGTWKGWSNGFQKIATTGTMAVASLPAAIANPNPGGTITTTVAWTTARAASMILATFYGTGD